MKINFRQYFKGEIVDQFTEEWDEAKLQRHLKRWDKDCISKGGPGTFLRYVFKDDQMIDVEITRG